MKALMRAVGLPVALAAAPAWAQVEYFETFNGAVNAGGWTFGAPMQAIQPSGGSPGPFFRSLPFSAATPFVGTGVGVNSAFVGNYRAAGQTITFRVYLKVFATDVPVTDRVPATILYNDNGSPGDTQDDWGAYSSLVATLAPAGQWRGYFWTVPTQSSSLPSGWNLIDFGPNPPANRSWDILIQDVDRLMFSYGNPTATPAAQMWDIGIDDILISSVTLVCAANCDRSTVMPCLNVNDFVCFVNQFAGGSHYANCDSSTIVPILNVNDYVCFLMRYAAGCGTPCQ